MKIRVKALASVYGMTRGQEYVLNSNATVDALLDRGFITWEDAPEPAEEAFDLTPEVLARAAADKKPAVEKSVRSKTNPAKPEVKEIVPPAIKPSPKTTDPDYISPEQEAALDALINWDAEAAIWGDNGGATENPLLKEL